MRRLGRKTANWHSLRVPIGQAQANHSARCGEWVPAAQTESRMNEAGAAGSQTIPGHAGRGIHRPGERGPRDTRRECHLAAHSSARRGGRTIPAMGSEEDIWYELRPDSHAGGGAERYGEQAAAQQAATAMLIRQPGVQFVEIVECGRRAGSDVAPAVVARIAASQPPAPAEAEVDDLHKLPRGAPEC
jgi:hypothetical protein